MKKIVIAIDGYSACGKSSTAKEVANRLGYVYIDTGAMYRAVTLYFLENFIQITNQKDVQKALDKIKINFQINSKSGYNEVYLNGLNVEDEIRSMEVSDYVSEVSALVNVRHDMVSEQRKMAKDKAVVMDGRDIGTHVFPKAELKIFMTANFNIRAERRRKELLEKNILISLEKVKENLAHRDRIDTHRTENPLRQAEDAYLIDTSHMTMEEQIEKIVNLANEIIHHK